MPRNLIYPLPAGPDEFERLSLKLFRRHWQLPQLERLSVNGDRSRPVDLIEISGRSHLSAVQCESRAAGATLGESDLRELVERATVATLPIGRLVIATTARRNARLEHAVFDLNRSLKANGPLSVEVMTWDDIGELLDEYPDVLTEFDGAAGSYALATIDPYSALPAIAESSGRADRDAIDDEIDQARAYLDQHKYQMARLRLLRLREGRWDELTPAHKFRVLSNLAAAWLAEGEVQKAAMLFVAARSLAPDDETACNNDALAYGLLGEHERAFELAGQNLSRFPHSGRALALRINNAPPAATAEELEAEITPELEDDPEAARVMARRALAEHDAPRAERYGRIAAAALENELDSQLVLGQAILLADLSGRYRTAEGAAEARIKEAETLLTKAIELARAGHNGPAEVQALIARAQARLALRNNEGAEKDIEEAYSRERKDVSGLCQYGILLRSRGRLNDALEAFRRAAAVGASADAEYHLAATLHERSAPGDMHEAADVLVNLLTREDAPSQPFYADAAFCMVDTMCRLELWHEAGALLDQIAPERVGPLALATMRAQVSWSQGNWEEASQHADAALREAGGRAPARDRRALASLLNALGRYADALSLWQELAAGNSGALDGRRLLECATRLGRDDVTLEVLRKLRETGAADPSLAMLELEVLEHRDPAAALQVMRQYLDTHPDDRVMRLRRSALALRAGRPELAERGLDQMPAAAEATPAQGRVAVELLRSAGQADQALRYAYDLVRRNFGSADAHRAYLAALAPLGPMPEVADFETAEFGAAVCYVENESGSDKWVVLDDTDDPDESHDEIGTTHPLARLLRGKRVGAKFMLPEGNRFSRPSGVIKQIISKYAYRFQDVLKNWSQRFPATPDIELAGAKAGPAEPGEPGPEPSLAAEAGASGEGRALERAYTACMMPVHLAAERFEMSDMQAWLTLAGGDDAALRCCDGGPEESAEAIAAFTRSDAVVIDISAIATLFLLGRVNHLPGWPKQFVVAQSTLAELRRLAQDERLTRLPPAVLSATGINKGSGAQLRKLADTLQSICRVRDGSALAALGQERRKKLLKLFGRHGAESVALGAMPGHALWSDDRIVAGIAKTEFGVRRIWTQAALAWRVQAGTMDNKDYVAASTELIGWGYNFTAPSLQTWLRAGEVAKWNRNLRPLKQALDQFASDAISLADALRIAAQLMVTIYDDNDLRSVRRGIMVRILDQLGRRKGAREAIEAIPQALPVRYGLDLIRAREAADVVRGWSAQNQEAAAAAR